MYANLYYIFFVLVLICGIIVIPSSFAYTREITIIPGTGASNHCSYTSTCFTPSIIHISVGDTIRWTNADNVNHTMVSGLPFSNQVGIIFDSGIIPPGKTYSFTFYDAGVYKYSDKINKWMVGEINVESKPSTSVPEFGTLSGLITVASIIGTIVVKRTFVANKWI